jgi:hypothetical protein
MAPFVGAVEILCGTLVLVGLFGVSVQNAGEYLVTLILFFAACAAIFFAIRHWGGVSDSLGTGKRLKPRTHLGEFLGQWYRAVHRYGVRNSSSRT